MYCYHCGLKIDEHKIETSKSSFNSEVEVDSEAKVQYICPRCGHLIHEGMSLEDSKELSRASHAQIQRAANSFARGMCMNALGGILLIIAIIFFVLANKPAYGFVLQTNCAEFYVSVVSFAVSAVLLGFGLYLAIKGASTRRHYTQLLKDINNRTFVQ